MLPKFRNIRKYALSNIPDNHLGNVGEWSEDPVSPSLLATSFTQQKHTKEFLFIVPDAASK